MSQLITGPDSVWVELAKESLRHSYRQVVTTIMAGGVDEPEAELLAYVALCDLEKELLGEVFE